MSSKSPFVWGSFVLLVGVVVVFAGRLRLDVKTTRADDAMHTTTLNLGTFTFDQTAGAESAVVATLGSTDPVDARWTIGFFVTAPGQPEELASSGEALAGGGTGGFTYAMQQANLPSGALVRASYQAFDAGGNLTFGFSRTVSIP